MAFSFAPFRRLFRRSYDGASMRPSRFEGGAARYSAYGPETGAARGTLQSRARHYVENHPLASAAVGTWESTAIGAGIRATSQHPDPDARRQLDAYFARWSRRADFEGLGDFYALQARMVRAERTDGECFALWRGDQLQLLPAEQVDDTVLAELANGAFDSHGVRVGADGRREGYHVLTGRPDATANYAPPVLIPASEMLHLYRPAGPGALRGVSPFAKVLLRLSELDGTEDAFIKNVRVSALLSVLLVDENNLGGENPLAEIGSLEPGSMPVLPGGLRPHVVAPQQVDQVGEFLTHIERAIAAGLDVPHYAMTGDMRQANYSSLRSAMVQFRQKIEAYQYLSMVPMVLDPVWRRVITDGVLSGQLDVPGFEDDPEAFLSVEWIAPKAVWIDPQKDAAATREMLDMGIMSRRQAVAEQGYSIEELDAEIAADRTRESELGLSFSTNGGGDEN